MSDERLRQLERNWHQDPSDIEAHAQYLSGLLRIGLLKENRILAAALWGHQASRRAMIGTLVKKDAIIYCGKRISILETRDIIKGSEHLPVEATRRIALGIAKLTHATLIDHTGKARRRRFGGPVPFEQELDGYTPFNVDLGAAIVYAEAYLTGNTTNDELWKVLKKINEYGIIPRRAVGPWLNETARMASLEIIIYNCCIDIATDGSAHKIPVAAVAWFTDDEILKTVRAELYPWALGDVA